ncbi:sulfurtransferase TusA family protein [Candidatus Contubernalis alkaliaceticus]|uniref:sulfurtransferase TusA family protein n=1 Tax=Candidatus Contubernalis alkaliaceticus TaxID=338645 RepID=UPI001F4C2082|nr:sulfurtransferase TusA family protein [Candidatus Contubernalis alkalaceticus]
MSEEIQAIDARGKLCPEPVVLTRKAMDTFPGEALLILVDSPVAKENVSRLAKKQGYKVTINDEDGDYLITIKR